MQTLDCPGGRELPVDEPAPPYRNPVEYLLHCLEQEVPVAGPLSLKISRIGQQIVDTACQSAREGRTLPLLGE